jgi:hypothetical protein
VESLGLDRLRALHATDTAALLAPLFGKESEQATTGDAIASIERLVRYVRDLHALAQNFANFRQFYEQKELAIFQAGTLYLDSRATDLCIRVEDAGKHATMAPLSRTYLAY